MSSLFTENNDYLFIRRLQIETTIGVHEWEQKIKQKLWIDGQFYYDIAAPAVKDDIALAIDYCQLKQAIISFAEQNSYKLLETFAHRLAEHLFQLFNIQSLELNISKPQAIAEAADVGICITRQRRISQKTS